MVPPQAPGAWREITPAELAARQSAGDAPRIIDVREAHEWALVRVDGTELMPLSEINRWWTELDPEAELVFLCHHGNRSASVCQALAAEGFADLLSLAGGIDAWAVAVDPSLPRY